MGWYTMSSDDEDEMGPISLTVFSIISIGAGWFLRGADNYVLAFFGMETPIPVSLLGWGALILGVLGLLAGIVEIRDKYFA